MDLSNILKAIKVDKTQNLKMNKLMKIN